MVLEQVATTTVTSAVSSVTLNGINDDSIITIYDNNSMKYIPYL